MMIRRAILLLLFLALTTCGRDAPAFYRPAMIVLGMDGLDPNLLRRGMAEGRLPNFKRLAEAGQFSEFGTALPPESPVAWANFITGLDSGGHGLFDFIHRKITRNGISIYLAAAEAEAPSSFFPLPGYRIPMNPGGLKNLLKGKTLWARLVEAGVPCSVVRIPDNFPPVDVGARTFSGMGTPDLLGTQGVFTFWTESAPDNVEEFDGKGEIEVLRVVEGVARTKLTGPENTFVEPERPGRPSPSVTVEVVIYVDREREAARIDIGDETRILRVGEWSDWVPVSFTLIPNVASAAGIVRLHLKSVDPLQVYGSPVNIDPRDPAQPVSTPADESEKLAAEIGPYYTQGMAEETHGARTEALDTGEFIDQTKIVLAERRKMLEVELARFRKQGGFSFFYYSSTDLCAHILWQLIDPDHPFHHAEDAKRYGRRIDEIYEEMDDVLGHVMDTVPEGTRVVVMSDHGFAPLRRKFSLNTWLFQNGFLRLKYPDRQGDMDGYRNVDWYETQAYAVGFCGIYLNLQDREKMGTVMPGEEAERVKQEIIDGLEAVVDEKTGEHVITKVYRREDVYHGAEAANGPDLVVGFNRTYENMDESVKGSVPRRLIEDNMDHWSGSHLMDPSHVPGVLLANTKFTLPDPELKDLTVTILRAFGVTAPELPGRPVWGD